MANTYVKAYYDWVEQTEALSDAERGRLFIAILEYARDGKIPDSTGREMLLFPVFKSVIDRDAKKSASMAVNGSAGGIATASKRQQNAANDSKSQQTPAKASKTHNIRHKTEDIKHNTQDIVTTPETGAASEWDNAFSAFEEMRKKIHAPLTDAARKETLRELEKLAPGDSAKQARILLQSVQRGWRGVFPLKNEPVVSIKQDAPHKDDLELLEGIL